MDIEIRYLGSGKGCHGWTTSRDHPLPEGVPEGQWVKVIEVDNGRGWMPWTTLTVVTRKGDRWEIRKECFEQDCVYSLDGGKTFLNRKDYRVLRALTVQYCLEEADLDESQRRVELTGRLLKHAGGDPEWRRRRIAEIERALEVPCGGRKPSGSRYEQWKVNQANLKAELRRVKNGEPPRDPDDESYLMEPLL